MSEDKREACARALYKSGRLILSNQKVPWDKREPKHHEVWFDLVDIIVAELRDPSEAMDGEGYKAACRSENYAFSGSIAKNVWQAMIDAVGK